MIRKIIKIQQSHAINVSYKQVEDLRIVHIKKVMNRLPLGLEIGFRISAHPCLLTHHTSTIHYFTKQHVRN